VTWEAVDGRVLLIVLAMIGLAVWALWADR
jgi:hypothetical protein